MKRMKQVLALLLSLALLLGMAAVAEEAEAPVEAEVVEIVEEAEPIEEPAPELEEAPEEPEVVDPEAEEPVEEPVEEPEAEPAAEEEFSMETESFDAASDFVIENGVLTEYNGSDADVVIPDSVQTIEKNAFNGCETMKSLVIPGSVTCVNWQAVTYCSSLEKVTLQKPSSDQGGNGLIMRAGAFDRTTNIKTLIIERSDFDFTTDTLRSALRDSWESIETVVLPKEVPEGRSLTIQCWGMTALKNVQLNGMREIGALAFAECPNLEKIDIPNSVTKIGNSAFWKSNIRTIDIPSSVTEIGEQAFSKCAFLESVTVPTGVQNLLADTFNSCDRLETVIVKSNLLNTNDAFKNCPALKSVYLPQNSHVSSQEFKDCPQLKVYLFKAKKVNTSISNIEKYCKQHNIPCELYDAPVGDATVSLSLTETTLTQKEAVTLKASTTGLSKSEKYSFTSSDKSVATVSSKGKITAQGVGTAVITAKGKTSKQSASCTVTVISAPQTVRIEKPTKVDYTTDDEAFSLVASVEPADAAQSIKWSSSDETVARVSEDGQVTLVGQGKATITAKSEKKGTNGKQRSDSFALNVDDPHMPANVKIVEKASGPVYVDKDKPLTLHYAMDPVKEGQEPISAVTWTIPKSKERKIATINSETGEITPLKEGSATVKITTQKKGGTGSKKKQLTDTVKITVVDPTKPRSVMINEGEKEIPLYYEAGKTLELKSTIEPETATPGVKWSISSKTQRKIATIDSTTGVVTPTGTKFGVVTVKVETTAKKSNKKAATATIKIAVVDPKLPYSVKITQEDGSEFQDGVELKVGQTLKLSALIEPETATENTGISWSISKSQKKYATVDQDGTVHGVKAGKTVTVTAKTENGKKATIKIKIVP